MILDAVLLAILIPALLQDALAMGVVVGVHIALL
jgi:hypothetical protein